MYALAHDLALAVRRLRAVPVFTVFAILTLALGIGVTTAIYSLVQSAVAPPSGVQDPENILNVNHSAQGGFPQGAFSWPDYLDLNSRQGTLTDVSAWAFFRQAYTANGRADTAYGELVAGNYFGLLGVHAALGRVIQPADQSIGAPAVAMIGHQVWQRVFGGASDVIGRTITMNGHPFEIVGVAPETFRGLFNNGLIATALWVPVSTLRLLPREGLGYSLDPSDRERRWLLVKARLRREVRWESAQAEITTIGRRLDQSYPLGLGRDSGIRMPYQARRAWVLQGAAEVMVNENVDRIIRPLVFTVMAAVALVLLVACTNLANLMVARATERRHETAVRLALGATRSQLLRHAMAEGAVLSVTGGIIGVGIARVMIVWLRSEVEVGNGAVLRLTPVLDATVLLASALATLAAIAVAGFVPAWQSTGRDVRATLAGAAAGIPQGWRGRQALIAAQVGVSFVLLMFAALCITLVRQANRNDSGIAIERLALLEVDFGLQQYDQPRIAHVVDDALASIRQRPDVVAVSASSGLPFGIGTPGGSMRASGRARAVRVELMAATPSIFSTLGIPIRYGRPFGMTDTRAAPPVAVVSEKVARDLFDTPDVTGRVVTFKRALWAGRAEPVDVTLAIVGVAADTDAGAWGRRDHGIAYLPLAQHQETRLVLAARTTSNPRDVVGPARAALRAADQALAVSQSGTALSLAGPPNLFVTAAGAIAALLGGFALLLAMVGLFGAPSHIVARRTQELGVRLALGATRFQIVRLVVLDGLRPVLLGIMAGAIAGALCRMAIRPFFVRTLPTLEPLALAVVPALLIATAVTACALPARRASRVDPSTALRDL